MQTILSEPVNTRGAELPLNGISAVQNAAAAYSESFESERCARQKAESESRAKDEFFAFFLHELRNPLNAVNGWTQMLSAGKLDSAEASKAIQTIRRNTDFLNDLIDDLLESSNIISGRMSLQTAPVDLRKIIEDALEDYLPAAEKRNVVLIGSFEQAVCEIDGDAKRLRQILDNLINNSLKFTPSGGYISVDLQKTAEQMRIIVKDSGIGIKPDFLPLVFERFQQDKTRRQISNSGLGLGLAVVKHLVEMHNGSIEVASEGEGQGAEFTVIFSNAAD